VHEPGCRLSGQSTVAACVPAKTMIPHLIRTLPILYIDYLLTLKMLNNPKHPYNSPTGYATSSF
jgi:hypothetical protein